MYNVILLDTDEKAKAMIKKDFEENGLNVVGDFSSSEKALNKIKEGGTDIVIMDLVLPEEDGFIFLEKLNKLAKKPKVIVISSLSLEGFIQRSIELGAQYFMLKPCNVSVLRSRVMETIGGTIKITKNKQLEEKITNIFITVGIPAHIKGYQFLREAIKLAIANPEIINSITKKLYPSIAERFDTSASKVERAIRHAIEVAWNRGKIENINQLFGITVYTNNEKPTNGEFIALVADKMLIEGA